MKQCPNCGSFVDDNAAACQNCGTMMANYQAPPQKRPQVIEPRPVQPVVQKQNQPRAEQQNSVFNQAEPNQQTAAPQMSQQNNAYSQYQQPVPPMQQPYYNQMYNNAPVVEDKVSIGLCILAYLVPLFGWIYWGVKKSELPVKSRACGIVATVSFAINLVLSFISSIIASGHLMH